MPKVGKDWKCDLCGVDAEYKIANQFFCGKHWWEYDKQPRKMSQEQIEQKQKDVAAWNRGYK